MQLSNIVTNDGLLERVEFFARLPYGSSGNTRIELINCLNRAYDNIMPLMLSYSDFIRFDDTNHTDQPIGYRNLVSGQPDYKTTTDENSYDIINLANVRILLSTTGTVYTALERMYINDERAEDAMSPDASITGTPTHFLEVNNTIYLYPQPNYSATDGIELFFERQQVYFTVSGTSASDTTKPGIPSPFHDLLCLYASEDWIMVNRPDDSNTINRIEIRIQKKEKQLFDLISMKNPTRTRMTTSNSGSIGNTSGRLNYQGNDSCK